MPDIEKAIEQLNNAVTVSAAIQERHAQLLSEHAEMLHGVHKSLLAQNKSALTYIEHLTEHRGEIDRMDAEIRQIQKRTDLKLEEITDKLNGLIGYVAGIKPPARERSRERDYEGRIDRRRDVV
jgi:hypothetical protein